MYKKQLTCQKIVCLLCVVAAVILFLYSLGIMTDLYDALYSALNISVDEDPASATGFAITVRRERVEGASLYVTMQTFNKVFVKYAIVYIILAVLLFVTNTSTRRKYYVSNYAAIGLFTAASVYIPIFAHRYIEIYKASWVAIDKAALLEHSQTYNSIFTESTLWFDLHYVVFVIMGIIAALLVACMVWKLILMKEEKQLVEDGKKVKA